MSIHEVARRIRRDRKNVQSDLHALLDAGILNRPGDGRMVFPFDTVHADFMLTAAA